jgi:hypothetical protein
MPRVAAFKLADPITVFVLMESNDFSVAHLLSSNISHSKSSLYGKPNVNSAVPAATATYCFPSTAYVIGEE